MTARRVRILLLVFMVFVGGAIRLDQSNDGLPYMDDPGEPQLVSRALRMLQTGDFNPHLAQGSLMVHTYLAVDVAHFFEFG